LLIKRDPACQAKSDLAIALAPAAIEATMFW
jgi:hypothetical protein